jgi:hypothetical protein
MTLQLGALRDALIEAGASPEKASAAAEELAGYENRLASMDSRPDENGWPAQSTDVDGRLCRRRRPCQHRFGDGDRGEIVPALASAALMTSIEFV